MIITKQFLLDNRTKKGAYTKKQLQVLNVDWPPRKGWQYDVVGNYLTDKEVMEFKNAVHMRSRSKKS